MCQRGSREPGGHPGHDRQRTNERFINGAL
jgi:hypothetical protein